MARPVCALLIGCATVGVACRAASPPETPTTGRVTPLAPLGALPVSVADGVDLKPDAKLTIRIETEEPQRVAGRFREHGDIVKQTDRSLTFEWDYLGTPSEAQVEPKHRAPSFVVDFDEEAVQSVVANATRQLGQSPTPDALTAFVSKYIETREYGALHIASRVATRRAGDCTEHAVFLAALGRAFGLPTRIALGHVLIPDANLAVGHAWTEIHDGEVWRPYDSALAKPVSNHYVVVGYIEDEGPGYRLGSLAASVALGAISVLKTQD